MIADHASRIKILKNKLEFMAEYGGKIKNMQNQKKPFATVTD